MNRRGKIKPYLSRFYQKNKLTLIVAILIGFGVSGVNLAISWDIQQLMDTISGVPGSADIISLTWLTVGIVLVTLLLELIGIWTRPRFVQRAMRQYRDYAFRRLMRKSWAAFSRDDSSLYLSAFTNDAATIEAGCLDAMFSLIFNVVIGLGALVMLLCYDPLLTLIACGFFALPVAVSLLAGRWAVRAERDVSRRNQRFVATLQDALRGFSTIRTFGAEETVINRYEDKNVKLEAVKRHKGEIMRAIQMAGGLAGAMAQVGTFVVGGWMAFAGRSITAGVLFAFINLTGYIIQPVQELPALLASRKSALNLVEKLADALEESSCETGTEAPEAIYNGIDVSHVSFGYHSEEHVLRDVTTRFEAGKCYAVVGSSGSGKSTLLRLLLAQRVGYEGSIRYDGLELREIQPDTLCDLFGVIEQNVFLFNATIRENITMFRDYPEEDVEQAIHLSGLDKLIAEKGPDCLCGENGAGLSGGERQRISVARSLLRRCSVLLVDEATAALDRPTARQVSEAILDLPDMTKIVVTHDLDEHMMRRYDGIVALKNGRVEEQGTFDELMARKGFFYSLYTVTR